MSAPEARIAIARGNGELALYRYGPAAGRSLLAIHGVTSSHLAWQFLADALVPRGFTIWAPDLRGRGDSHAVGAPYGMATHAADLVAMLDAAGVDSTDVVGHSMGGFVAVALQHLYPQRVSRLSLLDGGVPLTLPPGFAVEQVMPLILGPALARLAMTFASIDEYRAFWQQNPSFDQRGWNVELDRYLAYDLRGEAGVLHPATAPEAVSQDSTELWGDNVVDAGLRALTTDVLMLRAERGLQNEALPLYPEMVLAANEAKFPRVRVRTIPDTNHYDLVISAEGAALCAQALYPSEQ